MSDTPAVDGYGRPLRRTAPPPGPVPTALNGQANLGFELVAQLKGVGLDSLERLATVGAKEAWLRLRLQYPERGDLHTLLCLQGAIDGILVGYLPPEEVDLLRNWRDNHLRSEHQR